jgi:flagellar basal body-associated protein FliL
VKGNEGSRNLIIVLVVLVVIAAAVWAFRLIGGGSSAEDEQLEGLPQKPADLPPVSEEEKAAVPGPIDLR